MTDDEADDGIDELLRKAAHVPEHALPTPNTPDAAPLPATLGLIDNDQYRVVGEHARGGMGRILVAHQTRLGRVVAVKELLVRDSSAETRFMREALITAKLQHPSIIPVHDAGRRPSGEPFYVMKLVSGRPLSALIGEKQTVRERLALLPTVIAAAEAVAYAHSHSIIHRDLKPSNVLVGDFGETVVIDWGLGKSLVADPSIPASLKSGDDQTATQAGEVVGTPDFMSPEQAAGRPLDERADVYALGAILYVLLAGRPPYDGRSAPEILQRVRAGAPTPLDERVRGVPRDLSAVVQKAMARDLDARYRDAAELAADLRRFFAGQLVAAYRYPKSVRVRRWAGRHPALVAALVVAMLVGAVAFARVAAERDRAERARQVAESALIREAQANDRAALSQARQLLDHDPTASLMWLRRLRPSFGGRDEALRVAVEAAERGVAERILDAGSPVLAFDVSEDGRRVVTAGEDGRLRAFSTSDGKVTELGTLEGARQLTLSRDGKWLAVAGQTALAISLDDGARPLMPAGGALSVALSPDGKRLAIGGRDSSVHLIPLDGGAPTSFALGSPALQLVWSRDGKFLVVRALDQVRLVDGTRPLSDGALRGSGNARFSDDGLWLAAGGHGEVRLWDLSTGRVQHLVQEGEVADVAFAPKTAGRLAAASSDGAVRIWDLPQLSATPLAHAGASTRELVFSPDGASLMVTRGNLVRIYSLPSGHVKKLRGHTAEVSAVRFVSNNRAASASHDGTVRLWRLDPLGPPADPSRLAAWLELVTPTE